MGYKIIDTTGEATSWLTRVYDTKEEAEEEIRQLEADDAYRANPAGAGAANP